MEQWSNFQDATTPNSSLASSSQTMATPRNDSLMDLNTGSVNAQLNL